MQETIPKFRCYILEDEEISQIILVRWINTALNCDFLHPQYWDVYVAKNTTELFQKLEENNNELDLLILDIWLTEELDSVSRESLLFFELSIEAISNKLNVDKKYIETLQKSKGQTLVVSARLDLYADRLKTIGIKTIDKIKADAKVVFVNEVRELAKTTENKILDKERF